MRKSIIKQIDAIALTVVSLTILYFLEILRKYLDHNVDIDQRAQKVLTCTVIKFSARCGGENAFIC